MQELRERLQARENDNTREVKRREKTQKELQDVRSKLDEELKNEEAIRSILSLINGIYELYLTIGIDGWRNDLHKAKQHSTELEKQLSDAKTTIEKSLRDYDTLLAKTQKVSLYIHPFIVVVPYWWWNGSVAGHGWFGESSEAEQEAAGEPASDGEGAGSDKDRSQSPQHRQQLASEKGKNHLSYAYCE